MLVYANDPAHSWRLPDHPMAQTAGHVCLLCTAMLVMSTAPYSRPCSIASWATVLPVTVPRQSADCKETFELQRPCLLQMALLMQGWQEACVSCPREAVAAVRPCTFDLAATCVI